MSVLKVLTVVVYLVAKIDTAHRSHLADDLVGESRHLHDYRHIVRILHVINRHDMLALDSPDLNNRGHCAVDAGKVLDAYQFVSGRIRYSRCFASQLDTYWHRYMPHSWGLPC